MERPSVISLERVDSKVDSMQAVLTEEEVKLTLGSSEDGPCSAASPSRSRSPLSTGAPALGGGRLLSPDSEAPLMLEDSPIKIRRPVSIRSPSLRRRFTESSVISLSEDELRILLGETQSAGKEVPLSLQPDSPVIPSHWYSLDESTVADGDLVDGDVDSELYDDFVEPPSRVRLSSKERLMRKHQARMQLNCIGVLLGDSIGNTLPMLQMLSPRDLSHSVASLSESTTMFSADDSGAVLSPLSAMKPPRLFTPKSPGMRGARIPCWSGVFLVGNYKYEDTANITPDQSVIETTQSDLTRRRSEPVSSAMRPISSTSTVISTLPESSKKRSKTKSKRIEKMKSTKHSRTVSIGVPKELIPKERRKRQSGVLGKTSLFSEVNRTFCYDSYSSDCIFFGSTLSFGVRPFEYNERAHSMEEKKEEEESKDGMIEEESEILIHPQVLFECFSGQIKTLSKKRKKKRKPRRRSSKRSSLSSSVKRGSITITTPGISMNNSVMTQPSCSIEMSDDGEIIPMPVDYQHELITQKPGVILVHVMQDLKVAKAASSSVPKAYSVAPSSEGLSSVDVSSSMRSASIDAGSEDFGCELEISDDFKRGVQEPPSLRLRSSVDGDKSTGKTRLLSKRRSKKELSKAKKRGTKGMKTRQIAVGLIKVSEVLDQVKCVDLSTLRSDTVMLQIPLFPPIDSKKMDMISMLMQECDIRGYSAFLSSVRCGRLSVAKSEVLRPGSIGSLICSVRFNWDL